jgi:DNA-binding transcriptional ArsR family regulator
LRVLERNGEIRRVARGASVRFYAKEYRFDVDALPPLAFFQRRILKALVVRGESGFGDLVEDLKREFPDLTITNVSYHLKELAREKELISTRRDEGRTIYFLDSAQRERVERRLNEEEAADRMMEQASLAPAPGDPAQAEADPTGRP